MAPLGMYALRPEGSKAIGFPMNPTGAVPTTLLEAKSMLWRMPPAGALPSCPAIEKPRVPARFKCIRPATMAVKGTRLKNGS
jgi:hypothetical protein